MGRKTSEEMLVGYVGLVLDQEFLSQLFLDKANQQIGRKPILGRPLPRTNH